MDKNIDLCEKCGLYKTSCVYNHAGSFTAKKVMGVGCPTAKIMFVGEALGIEETIQQKPFVGDAGKKLNTWLQIAGINRDEVYITNTVKCRPPDNRIPKRSEITCCLPNLLEEIKTVKPKIICPLGVTALEAILKRKGITQVRGSVFDVEIEGIKVKVIPTFHPAHVLRRPEFPTLEEEAIKDIKMIKEASLVEDYQKTKKPVNYTLTDNVDIILEYINKIKDKKLFAYDIETEGFNFLKDSILSMALSCNEMEAVSFDFREFVPDDQERVFNALKEIFESKEILKIGHNAKFDNKFLRTYGIQVKLPLFDTMLAHFLIDENTEHGLKELAWRYTDMGGYDEEMSKILKETKKAEISILLEKKKDGLIDQEEYKREVEKLDNFAIVPKDILLKYNAGDTDCTLRLYNIFKELLQKENLTKIHDLIMIPLQQVLLETEYNGIQIDIDFLNKYEAELLSKIKDIEFRIYDRPEIKEAEKIINEKNKTPKTFNVKSTKNLQILLYQIEKLQCLNKTKSGGMSTNAATLEVLADKSEIVRLILEHRKYQHDLSAYVGQIKGSLDDNNRAHTSYLLHGSVTARPISREPNLQNIPRGTSPVKKLFIADPGCLIVAADYKQIEYRMWANYSNDAQMLKDIADGLDIHSEVCCVIWPHKYKRLGDRQYLHILTNEVKSKVEEAFRVIAKSVVFGLIFGRGVASLVKDLKITENEATAIIRYILGKYPKANEWLEGQKKTVKRDKQVKNLFGLIRRLPEIDSKDGEKVAEVIRQCFNAPIQSGAANVVSIATVRVYNLMKKMNLLSRLILTIHDSLKYNVPVNEIDKAINCMKDGMCSPIVGIKFPLEVDMEIGPCWGNMVSLEEFNKDRQKYLKEWNR